MQYYLRIFKNKSPARSPHNILITGETLPRKKEKAVTVNMKDLTNISPGEKARIKELRSVGSIRRRLLDIGLIRDTEIECIGRSPLGDPTAFLIRGAVIAIRQEDCRNILIYE